MLIQKKVRTVAQTRRRLLFRWPKQQVRVGEGMDPTGHQQRREGSSEAMTMSSLNKSNSERPSRAPEVWLTILSKL